ncbi:MAG: uL15 family ribosomal protein [Patescibacteria group bacterium]|jgi:large subunit ribosomal protein L15
MQLHTLKRNTPNKKSRRVGRGGKRGKTSGRGTKGQKARAGRKLRPELRDTIKKIPKMRGHGKNRARTVNAEKVRAQGVNLGVLENVFSNGDMVNPVILVQKGVVRNMKGKTPIVKILGNGTLTKKLTIERCMASKSAKDGIEKAGGTIKM